MQLTMRKKEVKNIIHEVKRDFFVGHPSESLDLVEAILTVSPPQRGLSIFEWIRSCRTTMTCGSTINSPAPYRDDPEKDLKFTNVVVV